MGDNKQILIPDLSSYRSGNSRLKGLRCIHTHLNHESLSEEDLSDLILLSLDLIMSIEVKKDGIPGVLYYANILPNNKAGKGWVINKVPDTGYLKVDFLAMIQAMEDELSKANMGLAIKKTELAILVGVTTGPRWKEEERLVELEKLAISDNIEVIGRIVQRVKKVDNRYMIHKGKLRELVIKCLQTGSNILIFNNELTPTQIKSLCEFTELKIIDRSQLILDIFAMRAITREGKIQVELAQLKYLLPRLATKNTSMSRLTGGIGGRGPGETKLEINRRRVRDRITRLNRELNQIKVQRHDRRRLRRQRQLPVISIIGYTNAGKSTLLNTLTNSKTGVKDRFFETLDPSSRRLRFPREREVIITDTVGFIRDLPQGLMDAFAATLEELNDADLLLHIVDASNPHMEEQIGIVEDILIKLDLNRTPTLLVLNKIDRLDPAEADILAEKMDGVGISALDPASLEKLMIRIEAFIWPNFLIKKREGLIKSPFFNS